MSLSLHKDSHTFLYQQVIDLVREMQRSDALKAGDKLPSLRSLATKLSVSVPTIKQAYIELEQQGLIYAREKSGYYLKALEPNAVSPTKSKLAKKPVPVTRQQLIEQVYQGIHQAGNLPLGVANPVATMPASKALNRAMRRVMSVAGDRAFQYGPTQGYEPLRQQLAMRYLDHGLQVNADEIVITNGAQEAICLALQAVAKPGDVIAVETPCYFGILELIESLDMLAFEIPLCADESISIADIEGAVDQHDIAAVVLSSSIANPMGCWLSNSKKKEIVRLLESRNIPLIEDDVYGELYFGSERGLPAQVFSKKNMVLTCSSFSKTAAPGYRIGWVLAPGFVDIVGRCKRAFSCSAPLLNQWTITEYMRSGEYDRYIRHLRQVLQTNKDRMVSLVRESFGPNVLVSDPKGGAVLWLEFDRAIDGDELFQAALAKQISISPGSLFSPINRFKHCIRISYSLPWCEKVEQGVKTLASLVKELG
ncbi:PLP-dependent aminotransferase family protein [Corallincola holothuriorum]|uniref:PLP-dependent aminotransferase family protein n=1 Tax=Corallincola holothuriorum TaxID=2282215 RepID=A0A368NHD2_9GAMM|nr:PLP-dependent aminotransferase family protein [Corallincola holothuriorum]RCU49530.1 PLP-dependent aminotransferase family protein [Corallincola holothuriorum]